ncbi:MAG: hypothetical protein KatS3mg076_2970 [Candidatus Binatia bacterium]|nr:MAG: hypothetical protein KatS3mg076_2970 [Candidatus Binatia bacterium]
MGERRPSPPAEARVAGLRALVRVYRRLRARWRARGRCDYLRGVFVERIPPRSVRTVFELGCKDGADTVRLRDVFDAEVHAFECDPRMLPKARRRLGGEPKIRLVEKAVWDRDGVVPFYVVERAFEEGREVENPGASSCFRARHDYRVRYEQTEIAVEAIRLERYCAEAGVDSVDLLCMDIQGAELHALRGLGDRIEAVRFVVTEIERRPIYEGQSLFPEVDAYLRSRGFRRLVEVPRDPWFSDFLYAAGDVA